jgi:putative ABC transport system permease protein
MKFSEQIKLAFQFIVNNKLRATLTVIIIALGITALVGILTAIDGMENSISNSFTNMGANSFSLRNKEMVVHMGGSNKKPREFRPISFDEAIHFKTQFEFPAQVTMSVRLSQVATLEYQSKKTNPNIGLMGIDENYFKVSGYDIQFGRNFSKNEIDEGASVVVLGRDVAAKLFKKPKNAIDEIISVGHIQYRVVGVLASKGVSRFVSSDNNGFVPVVNGKRSWPLSSKVSYVITVGVSKYQLLNPAVAEAESRFRIIRRTPLDIENDFQVMRSDDLAHELISNLKYVTWACVFIAIITLIGAAIGLMNIMLVSVTERTREIGISKAIGATNKIILQQFLLESVLVCQMGGVLGVLVGLGIGNAVSAMMGSSFFIPWLWMILGLIICFVVGIAAGIYPALTAAKLNPINALRNE